MANSLLWHTVLSMSAKPSTSSLFILFTISLLHSASKRRRKPQEVFSSPQTAKMELTLATKKLGTTPSLLLTLPAEVHENIMAHLDTTSQICFGLTNRHFYRILFTIDAKALTRRRNLLFHTTSDNEPVYGDYNDSEYRDSPSRLEAQGIVLGPRLIDLLRHERLFANFSFCNGCVRFKPASAWRTFALEEDTLKKDAKRVARIEHWEWDGYYRKCRRCRAWSILVDWEGKSELWDSEAEWIGSCRSLGLLLEGGGKRPALDVNGRWPAGVELHTETLNPWCWVERWYTPRETVLERLGL